MAQALMTVEEASLALGVSRSTVWRLIQRGELATVLRAGRRLIQTRALRKRTTRGAGICSPAFSDHHPIFRLIGAGRGGGKTPGARGKHAILDQ